MEGRRSNWQEFRSAENWVDYILNRNLVATPGTVFAHSTGNSHLLAAALESATGMGELEYARENLFDALGMDSVVWGTDPQGIADGGNGISMTVRDAARFGQLYLQNGQWNGEQFDLRQWVAGIPPPLKSTARGMAPVPMATNGGSALFRAMIPIMHSARMGSLSLSCRNWIW